MPKNLSEVIYGYKKWKIQILTKQIVKIRTRISRTRLSVHFNHNSAFDELMKTKLCY